MVSVLGILATLLASSHAQEAYQEAPILAERVAAGELPPIEERLPQEPMVVEPHERIGVYGGTWNGTILSGGFFINNLPHEIRYEPLVRWKTEIETWTTDDIIPNVAASFEANEDGSEYTFYLREGMKWSDGHPFTADDIMFWYEDVFLNEQITPSKPAMFMSGEEPVVVEKLDDYTVIFRFAQPNGLFLSRLATGIANGGQAVIHHPRHHLEQFHISYNENADQDARDAGLDSWVDLFAQKVGLGTNPERPSLYPWKVTQIAGVGTGQLIVERNPYYWKVDPEGQQLPYIDRIVFDIVEDAEVEFLRVLSGEVHYRFGELGLDNLSVVTDYQERGNYRILPATFTIMNNFLIALNLAHEDQVKHEVFNNRDFRIGLSHAIDRDELVELIYVGQGEPWQVAPRPESGFYDEEMAKQYTEYNVELANEYLDRVLPERDAQGFRLGPDGNRFTFIIEIIDAFQFVDNAEQVQRYWQEVGIDVQVSTIAGTLFWTRTGSNLHDAAVWIGDSGMEAVLRPSWYFPFDALSFFGVPWAAWFNNPDAEAAIEPPAAAQEQMALYRQVQATSNPEEQIEAMRQIMEIGKEQFWLIGTTLPTREYGIVRNDFHNVPEGMPNAWLYQTPGPGNPEQFFIESQGQ